MWKYFYIDFSPVSKIFCRERRYYEKDDYEVCVELYWRGETEVLRRKNYLSNQNYI
jgi:hypothetical protein